LKQNPLIQPYKGFEGWNIGLNLSNTKPQHIVVEHFSLDPNNPSSHLILSMYDLI